MGKLKVHVLLKGLRAKTNLETGETEISERGGGCNETNVCKHDAMKMPRAGAGDVLVTTNNRPLITKTQI